MRLLAQNLPQLWQEVRNSRFSLLVRCTFNDQRHVTGCELVGGPYIHEK
jgi:hypothetical protein